MIIYALSFQANKTCDFNRWPSASGTGDVLFWYAFASSAAWIWLNNESNDAKISDFSDAKVRVLSLTLYCDLKRAGSLGFTRYNQRLITQLSITGVLTSSFLMSFPLWVNEPSFLSKLSSMNELRRWYRSWGLSSGFKAISSTSSHLLPVTRNP